MPKYHKHYYSQISNDVQGCQKPTFAYPNKWYCCPVQMDCKTVGLWLSSALLPECMIFKQFVRIIFIS